MTDYFNHPAISNSDLGLFIESPKYFRFCKDNGISKEAKSLDFGTYLHMLCLEPHLITQKYFETEMTKVEGNMGVFIETLAYAEESNEETRKNAYLASGFKWNYETVWKKFIETPENQNYYHAIKYARGKTIISPKEVEKAKRCIQSFKSNQSISRLLFESKTYFGNHIECLNEVEIFFEVDGIHCKSKIDRLIIDTENQIAYEIDIKTYSGNFMTNYKSFGYERQRAFYRQAIGEFCFEKYSIFPSVHSYIAAVNTEEPFESDLYRIEESDLDLCWSKFIHPKLMEMKECFETGIWEKKYKRFTDLETLNYILIRNDYYRK